MELTYDIRLDMTLKRPCVIYIHSKDSPTLTLHRVRASTVEEGEYEARRWISARSTVSIEDA